MHSHRHTAYCAAAGIFVCLVTQPATADSLPKPPEPFAGKISETRKDSKPDWPKAVKAKADAPNVVLILLDDVGFGASGTFGGAAATPGLDKLAAEGLRYNRFHTTALCSPTRSALLTGRNSHQAGFGVVIEYAGGYPGYNSVWNPQTASVAEILRQNGYSTSAFGKWHNTPSWEVSPAGPFDRWPTHLGFDYFYGFQGGATSQWEPRLYRNTEALTPPSTPAQGYHLTTDLVDNATHWLKEHESLAPDKPYFLYFATGATHAPHHPPKEWIAKYKGKFDQGWDALREETFARQKKLGVIPANAELTPRPKEIPAWESFAPEQKKLLSREMEVYAAFLEHTDHEVARLVDTVRKGPKGDNTIILTIVGDNGGSAEGTLNGIQTNGIYAGAPDEWPEQIANIDHLGEPQLNNNYAVGWAWATTTPFQWVKQFASHFGGVRNPLVVSWPAKIKDQGGLRSQFHHVNDIAPTLLELAGVKLPEEVNGVKQLPFEGSSIAYSFDNPNAAGTHKEQYFELFGNRSLYQDGWVAAARHGVPWVPESRTNEFDHDVWELYHVDEDFSEAHDLAKQNPDKLAALKAEWEKEAQRNRVYPLHAPNIYNRYDPTRPTVAGGRTSFTYYPGDIRLPESAVPNLRSRSHRIEATVTVPNVGAEGVLIAAGGAAGGFSFYVKDGKLVYVNNFYGKSQDVLTSTEPVPKGQTVRLAFDYTHEGPPGGAGTGRLFIDDKPVGESRFARVPVVAGYGGYDTVDVGQDTASPVTNAYAIPFAFSGALEKVVVNLK